MKYSSNFYNTFVLALYPPLEYLIIPWNRYTMRGMSWLYLINRNLAGFTLQHWLCLFVLRFGRIIRKWARYFHPCFSLQGYCSLAFIYPLWLYLGFEGVTIWDSNL